MRTTFDFSPLWRSTIGFDHLADLLDASLRQPADDHYPPYNVERSGDDSYRISVAVAGFGADDITVTAEQNTLIIEGKQPDARTRDYLYHGIASRPFRRVFNLADHVKVRQAAFENGLLIVDLVREVPESMKPRRIPIGGPASSHQIEQKAA
jgi:molecular chaperone IbpA